MVYKLKAGFPNITITDGECKGQLFEKGKVYSVIPGQYKDRFEASEIETKTKTKPVEDKSK
jgi:hypothetical protein